MPIITPPTPALYPGRFNSFPVLEDEHYELVCRYGERNASRAQLVTPAELWRWGSLWHRRRSPSGWELTEGPLPSLDDWGRGRTSPKAKRCW